MKIGSCFKLPENISYKEVDRSYQGLKVTTIALGVIALALIGTGVTLMGVGTCPTTMHFGMGVLPYFAGAHFMFLGTATLLGVVAFTLLTLYRKHQLDLLERSNSN